MLAGYFLGSLLFMNISMLQIGTGLFVYNILAFGGQYPVALWLEKLKNPKIALMGSYALNVVAACIFMKVPQVAIVLTGIASAVYHVAGGSICARENKAANIGLFAAPGVMGLIAGGYFAHQQMQIQVWLLATAVIFLALLYFAEFSNSTHQTKKEAATTHFTIDGHDITMILLLTVISLRSAFWNIFQLIHEQNYEWLLAIALAAFAGKLAGGFIADKIGWRLYGLVSLIIATPLTTFFKNELILFCIGIGLLQSGIPATTALLIQSVKGNVGRGIALSFGTAIILGAFIMLAPVRLLINSNILLIGFLTIVFFLFYLATKNRDSIKTRQ